MIEKITVMPRLAITHSGIFHADEVFAYAFLRKINPQIQLMRVPGNSFFETTEIDLNDKSIVVFDIGNGKFDHHSSVMCRPDGVSVLASFGKILQAYGHFLMGPEELHLFDYRLAVPIDCQDATSCVSPDSPSVTSTLSSAIHVFNPTADETDENAHFLMACDVAKPIIERYIIKAKATCKNRDRLNEIYENRNHATHALIMDEYISPSSRKIIDDPDVQWALYPSTREGWQILSLRDSEGKPKALIPTEIADKLANDPLCTFCHVNRFTAVFKTRERAKEVLIEIAALSL